MAAMSLFDPESAFAFGPNGMLTMCLPQLSFRLCMFDGTMSFEVGHVGPIETALLRFLLLSGPTLRFRATLT